MMQKSLQGGRPLYFTSISKWRPVGNRFPNSQELTVETATLKSLATFLSGRLFFRRQLLKAVAKLARMSHWNAGTRGTAAD